LLLIVADVADVKEHLGVDEFVDVTAEPLPVSISPTEVYAIHKILQQEIDEIVRFSLPLIPVNSTVLNPQILSFLQDLSGQDKIRNLLQELGGPPLPADASGREKPIALKLINRSAPLEGGLLLRSSPPSPAMSDMLIFMPACSIDPEAAEKAEWARAKRLILAVLRVQPDRDIMSALLAPVEDEHLELWASIAQLESHGLPPLPGQEATYNLNDIKKCVPYPPSPSLVIVHEC
jgi:Ras GTPase-activating-like protein IQGAP2/3